MVENLVTWSTCIWHKIVVVALFLNDYLDIIDHSLGQGLDNFLTDHVNQYLCSLTMESWHGFHMRYQSLTSRLITCRTFSKRFTVYSFSKWVLYLDIFADISSHRCGYDKLIRGARAQAHIYHNVAYSCRCIHRCSCRGDISMKVKLWVLIIEDGLGSSNIKA